MEGLSLVVLIPVKYRRDGYTGRRGLCPDCSEELGVPCREIFVAKRSDPGSLGIGTASKCVPAGPVATDTEPII